MIKPEVSVVIPTYRRGAEALTLAERFLKEQVGCTFEVLVVDQTDDQPDDILAGFLSLASDPRFRYFSVAPASLPGARNFGTARAAAPVVLFVDDDVEPEPDLVAAHARVHAAHPEVAAVAGRVKTPGAAPKPLFRIDWFGRNLGAWDVNEPAAVLTARGCNMSFRRSWLDRVGGFDTRFVGNAYREESDLCFRLCRGGGRILYEPSAALSHFEADQGGCREASAIHDRPAAYRNETLFLVRNFPFWRVPIMLAAVLWSFVFRGGQGLRSVRAGAFVKGVAQGFKAARDPTQVTLQERDR